MANKKVPHISDGLDEMLLLITKNKIVLKRPNLQNKLLSIYNKIYKGQVYLLSHQQAFDINNVSTNENGGNVTEENEEIIIEQQTEQVATGHEKENGGQGGGQEGQNGTLTNQFIFQNGDGVENFPIDFNIATGMKDNKTAVQHIVEYQGKRYAIITDWGGFKLYKPNDLAVEVNGEGNTMTKEGAGSGAGDENYNPDGGEGAGLPNESAENQNEGESEEEQINTGEQSTTVFEEGGVTEEFDIPLLITGKSVIFKK